MTHSIASLQVIISQDSCPPLLKAINRRYNDRCCISDVSIFFHGALGYDFLTEIRHYTCVKRSQVDLALRLRAFSDTNWQLLTQVEIAQIKDIHALITSEKRK